MITHFFSGMSKGSFNSTTHKVNDGTPQATPLGTSTEKVGVNVTNGNLTIEATDLRFPSPGLANALRRTYQGQGSGWKIAATPSVKIPQDSNPNIMYSHEDGYVSTFRKNADDTNYSCFWPEGRVTLTKNADGSSQIYISTTGRTELFDAKGYLRKRISWDGGELNYDYNAQGFLSTITDSLGKTLSLDYQGQTVTVKYDGKLYVQYLLDEQQRLTECIHLLENDQNYSIKFTYEGTSNFLKRISQSDGTVLEVSYLNSKVSSIGTPSAQQILSYEQAGITKVTAPEGSYTKWHYDTATFRLQKHESFNSSNVCIYTTQYQYDPNGYLQKQVENDNNEKEFLHDSATGWLRKKVITSSNGTTLQTQDWQHNEVGAVTEAKTTVGNKNTTVQHIYAKIPAHLLRFIISPTGQVLERRLFNSHYQCTEQYTYFTAPYTGEPTLEALESWVKNIQSNYPNQILTEKFDYHNNGQVIHHEVHESDGTVRVWDYEIDTFGRQILTKEPAFMTGERPHANAQYDNIGRVKLSTNAIKRTTTVAYQAATETTPYVITTLSPTHATNKQIFKPSGKMERETVEAEGIKIPRTVNSTYNGNNQIATQTDQLNRVTTTLYDDLGRGFGVVDAEGYVTYTYKDHRGRTTCIETTTKSRSWTIYDAFDRPVYTIDPTGLVTEYRYGLSSNPEYTIRYYNRIATENLSVTPSISDIKLQPHVEDIYQRDWFDNDRHIARLIQQNSTNAYLTEWIYHNHGEIIVQFDYEKPLTAADKWEKSLDELRTETPKEYVLTTRYYNHNKELIGTINDLGEGKGILHELIRDARGDDVETIDYYTPVTHTNIPQPLTAIRPPIRHAEDWVTKKTFDGIHRVTEITHPNGRKETFRYQDTTTPIEHIEYDNPLKGELRPAHARGFVNKVNGLEESTATLLSEGVDRTVQSPDDAEVWKIYGREIILDEAGRQAKQKVRLYTDPARTEAHQTIDYYDARDNLRFHIGAVGEVTEYSYDEKNNLVSTRHYARTINEVLNESEIANLNGGPLTIEAQSLLKQVRHETDRITTYEYDTANHKIAEIAANGQRILYAYTLHPQPSAIAEEFEQDHWRVTFTTYNSQGFTTAQRQEIITGTKDALVSYLNNGVANDIIVVSERQILTVNEINRFGNILQLTDGNGVQTEAIYDKRQRLRNKTCQTKPLLSQEYDTHDRIIDEKDSEPGSRLIEHATAAREQKIIYKDENGTTLPYATEITLDAFNQPVQEKRDQSISYTDFNAYDEPLTETNAIGEKTQHEYAISGIRLKSTDAAGHVEESLIDPAYRNTGNQYHAPEGKDYDQKTTINTLTAFGDTELKVTEIEGTPTLPHAVTRKVTKIKHDSRGKAIEITDDPEGLARLTLTPRRLDTELTAQSIASASKRNEPVREVALEKDGYGRDRKTVTKADDNLNLVTEHTYDAGDKPVTIKDANGDETQFIYAGHGLSTLTITPEGHGTLIEVDTKGNVLRQRRFAQRFTPEEITVIRTDAYSKDLTSLVLQDNYTSNDDLLTQNIYDRAGYLRFAITPGGQVTEYRYNNAGHKVCGCTFIHRVPVDKKTPYTIHSIVGVIKPNPEQDPVFHYITDAEGRALYLIDPERYLTGQTFNEFGLVEETIRYAERIEASEDLTTLTLERTQQLAQQREGNTKNKIELDFYSAHTNDQGEHLLRFEINSAGQITQFEYDVNNNVVKTTEYKAVEDMTLLRSMSYADIYAWCKLHDADEGNSVDETRYNTLNQKVADVDANGHIEEYENDLLGNVEIHRDQEGHEWRREHDRAGRQIAHYQPIRSVAQILFNAAEESFSITRQKIWVKTHYERDGIGRAKKTIEGKDLVDERTQSSEFERSSTHQIATTLHDVSIYHPELDPAPETGAARNTFEVKQNVAENSVYDAFGREVVVIYRDGSRAYTIYDADDNEIFKISTNGAVEGFEFDGLNRKVAYTQYFNKLQVNELYPEGITAAEMLLLMSEMNHPKDRKTTYTYDRLNRKETETLPKAIYVNPTATDNNQKFYNFSVQIVYTYGAFTEPLTETRINNPYKSRQSVKYFYYNDNNPEQLKATIDALGYLTEYFYDEQGWCVLEIAYANPCANFNQTEYEKPKLYPKDEYKEKEYDKNGNCLAIVERNVDYHEQIRQALDTPPTVIEKIAHRVTRTFFDKKNLPVITVRYMVDVQSKKNLSQLLDLTIMLHSPISNKDKPVTTVQLGPALKRIRRDGTEYHDIPVVAFAHDSHGRVVAQLNFANSLDESAYQEFQLLLEAVLKTNPSLEENRQKIIDAAYQLGAEETLLKLRDPANDRVSYTQYDAADNPITVQNPQGLTEHLNYTAVPQQVAKTTQWIQGWDNLSDRNHTPVMIAKPRVERKEYDRAGYKTITERWNGHGNEHVVKREQHSTFGEIIARGDENDYQEGWQYDNVGNLIATNENDGVWKRFFYQPQSKEPSLTITSPTVDLSAPAYDDPRRLMNLKTAERRESSIVHDDLSRPVEYRYPIYSISKAAPNVVLRSGKQTDPAMIETFGDYAITWPWPANYGTRARFWLRVYGTEEWIEQEVIYNNAKTYQGIKTWSLKENAGLITDDYEYKMELYHGDDFSKTPYASGKNRIPIVTPNMKDSQHAVCYTDPEVSSTKIFIAGKTTIPDMEDTTEPMTGVRIFPPYSDDPIYLGVTPDESMPGRFYAEARGVPRGLYLPGVAKIDRPIGNPYIPQDPGKLKFTSSKTYQNTVFLTEVSTFAHIEETMEVYIAKKSLGPDTIPPLPPEPPITEETEVDVRYYVHKAVITLTVTGLPVYPEGFVEVNLRLLLTSGETAEIKGQVQSSANGTTIITLIHPVETYHQDPSQLVWDTGYPVDEDGKPTEKLPDYPTEILEVFIQGHTLSPNLHDNDGYPLYQKAPNAQNVSKVKVERSSIKSEKVTIIESKRRIETKNNSSFPQRTLFVPLATLKTEDGNAPIAVRVTKPGNKAEDKSEFVYGTAALTKIDHNSNYLAANLSSYAAEHIDPETISIQPVGADPLPHPQLVPEPKPDAWVDTRKYGSVGGTVQKYNPDPNRILDDYISDVHAVYKYYSAYNYASVIFWFYHGLPQNIQDVLYRGQAIVKIKGYWFNDPSQQELELSLTYVYRLSTGEMIYYYKADSLFVPKQIDISVYADNKYYLIYTGTGEQHEYDTPGMENRTFSHHSSYSFIPENPNDVQTKYVEAYRKSDDVLISTSEVKKPLNEDYQYFYVEFPAEVKPQENYFKLIGRNPAPNPPVNAYTSDVIIHYEATFRHHVQNADCWSWRDYNIYLYNFKNLPLDIKYHLLTGQFSVSITGNYYGMPLTINPWKRTVITDDSIVFYTAFDDRLWNIHATKDLYLQPSKIEVILRNLNGADYLIYSGRGDVHFYRLWHILPDKPDIVEEFDHHAMYAFRPAAPRDQIVSVQAIRNDESQQVVATLPINYPYGITYVHDYVEIPANFIVADGTVVPASECYYQPVGPALNQNYPVQDQPIDILSYNTQDLHIAEGFWDANAWIHRAMKWTEVSQDWWDDMWHGEKWMWLDEGDNQIQVHYTRTDDLTGVVTYITIEYILESKTKRTAPDTRSITIPNASNYHFLEAYSVETSNINTPAKLTYINNVRIECEIDGQRITVYDDANKKGYRQQLVYITPLPICVARIDFEYRSMDSGINGLWMTLKNMPSSTGKAINVFDSSNLIPAWYDARIRAYDSEGKIVDINSITQNSMGVDGWYYTKFQITRQLGNSVPSPDLEQDVIAPIETQIWDRHNVVQRTDVRGAIFNYTTNRDRRVIKEVGPPIEVLEDEDHLTSPPPSSTNALTVRQGYTPFPLHLRGKFQPRLDVALITPRITYKGKEKWHDPRVKIKLSGLKNLPFEQYHFTLTFKSKSKPYEFPYTWVPQETKGKLTSKYQSVIHEDGCEETRQFTLQSEKNLGQQFFLPEGEPTWTLKAYHQGVWHTLVNEKPITNYRHQSGTEVTHYESHPQNTIVLFAINRFHTAEKIRYRNKQGDSVEVTAVTPSKARGRGRLYVAQLPAEIAQQELQFEALVPSQTVRTVPALKTVNPVQYHYFDSSGQHLGDRDANGHYWARVVDGKDNPIIEYSPLARKRLIELNVFSEPTATVDASGNVIVKILDKGGNAIEIRYMNGETEFHFYNPLSEELAFIDGRGNPKYTQPGLNGSTAERDADGVWKTIERHRTGEPTKEIFPDGSSHETLRDFVGRDLGGKDRGGAIITKLYDLTNGLLIETSAGGERSGNKHISYSYYPNGFRYQAYDQTHDALLEWTPEIGGEVYRREFISNQANGSLQFMLTDRNCLGWPTHQSDLDFDLYTYYDLVGNKRTLLIEAKDLGAADQVYTFDAERRTITARATRDLNTGALLWNTETHHTSVACYDTDFLRELKTYNRDKARYMHEVYLYDIRRRPEAVLDANNNDKVIAYWTFDAAGNLSVEYKRSDSLVRYGKDRPSYTPGNRNQEIYQENYEDDTFSTTWPTWGEDGTLASTEQHAFTEDAWIRTTITPRYQRLGAEKQEYEAILQGTVDPHHDGDEMPIHGRSVMKRDANGTWVSFEDEAEPENNKTFLGDMFGTLYARNGKESFRAYPDDSGAHVAEYDNENGGWRFGTALLSSTEVSPLPQTQTFTASEGTTLASLSQGSQEWLDALRQANPQFSDNEDLGGKQVKMPYGQTRHEMNISGRGMMPEKDQVIGTTLPTPHPPEIETPEPVGKLREAVSTVANIVVTIAAYQVLGPAAPTFLTSAFAGATAAALGAVTGQALSSQGFSMKRVGEAAALGGAMGATQVGITQQLGVTEQSIGPIAKAMETAGTSYLVNYATQSLFGQGSFDLRGLAGAMTGAVVSQTLLERSGFVTPEESRRYLTWQKQATHDLVAILEGLVEAGLAAAFSQEDINMQQWVAQSVGSFLGNQAGYGLKKLKSASTPEASWIEAQKAQAARKPYMTTADYLLYTPEQLLFGHKNAHRLVAPGQMAEPKSVDEAVKEKASKPLSPRKQKTMTHLYNTQVSQAQHQMGDPRAQAKKAKDTHVDVEAKSQVEAANAQAVAAASSADSYAYFETPSVVVVSASSLPGEDISSIDTINSFEPTPDYARMFEDTLTLAEGLAVYHPSPNWNKAGKGIGILGTGLSLAEANDYYAAGKTFEGNETLFSFTAAMVGGASASRLVPNPYAKGVVFAVGATLHGLGVEEIYYSFVTPPPERTFGVYPYNSAMVPIEYRNSYIAPMPQIVTPTPPLVPSDNYLLNFKP